MFAPGTIPKKKELTTPWHNYDNIFGVILRCKLEGEWSPERREQLLFAKTMTVFNGGELVKYVADKWPLLEEWYPEHELRHLKPMIDVNHLKARELVSR